VQGWLERPDLLVLGAAKTVRGIQRARVLTLAIPKPEGTVVFRAKWRANSTETTRNSPRRELAAHAVQKLFLDPDDYVVPPAAPHCFPLEAYREQVDPDARPTFPEVPCVLGVLSYWMEDVEPLAVARDDGWFHGEDRHAFDPDLFRVNATYRDAIADVNLLTYLIGHGDSHPNNFVISRDPSAPRVYSVDNSISLGLAPSKSLPRKHDWSRIRVPALPRRAVDRLRQAREQVEGLAAVAEMERSGDALIVVAPVVDSVVPPTVAAPVRAGRVGQRWVDGRLRIGLTASEIAEVQRKIDDLLARVDRGELQVY
jgi:hypothetical protein